MKQNSIHKAIQNRHNATTLQLYNATTLQRYIDTFFHKIFKENILFYLTAPGYEYIENHLASFINENYIECSLIQDNDGNHTNPLSIDALRAHHIHWERTAAYSPDKNTIELVWSDLKTFIRKRNGEALTI